MTTQGRAGGNQKLSMPSARPGVRGLRPGRRASRHRRDSSSSWLALFGLWACFARTILLPTGIQSRSHNHRRVAPDPPSSPNTSSYLGLDLGCYSYRYLGLDLGCYSYRLNFVGWMACAHFEDPCSSHHSVFLYHLHREFAPVNHSFFLRESRSFTTKTFHIVIPHTIYFVGGLDPSLHSSIVEIVICN